MVQINLQLIYSSNSLWPNRIHIWNLDWSHKKLICSTAQIPFNQNRAQSLKLDCFPQIILLHSSNSLWPKQGSKLEVGLLPLNYSAPQLKFPLTKTGFKVGSWIAPFKLICFKSPVPLTRTGFIFRSWVDAITINLLHSSNSLWPRDKIGILWI